MSSLTLISDILLYVLFVDVMQANITYHRTTLACFASGSSLNVVAMAFLSAVSSLEDILLLAGRLQNPLKISIIFIRHILFSIEFD